MTGQRTWSTVAAAALSLLLLGACGGSADEDPLDANGNGVLDPADVEEGDAVVRLFVDDGEGEREVATRTHAVELYAPVSSKRHRLLLQIPDGEAGLAWVLELWFGQTAELEPGQAPLARVTLDEYTTDFDADTGGTGETVSVTEADEHYASGAFEGEVTLVDVDVSERPTGATARLVQLAFHRIAILDDR